MLAEAQGNLTHLLFLCPRSTNAAQTLDALLSFIPHSPLLSLSLISSFHKSLFATFPPTPPPSSPPFCKWGMLRAHHFCRALIHFPPAPFSIHLASFSASATSHERSLSSTFSALISSSSHQSPSGLTAATSDLSVHASLSYSLHLLPAHSSLCLSQSISLSANRQAPLHRHQRGLEQWRWVRGGFTALKHFARQLLAKQAADSLVECQED